MTLCVVHLVRAANGVAPLRAFLESYRRHPAGMEHDLLLLFKGFDSTLPPEYEAIVRDVAHLRRFIADRGFDIDAYFQTARTHEAKWFCFLNSFSVILADGWLAKLHRALVERGAGAVGATGSWQSILDDMMGNRTLPPSFPNDAPRWMRLIGRTFPFLRRPYRAMRRRLLRGKFAGFPNYHLRTNAFLIPREVALAIRIGDITSKSEAYAFESGTRGLTPQLQAMGRPVLVVARDGAAFDMREWHRSNTFWREEQQNLLVARQPDAQVRKRRPRGARGVLDVRLGAGGEPKAGMINCAQCGGIASEFFVTTDLNRRLSDTPFQYLRCTACGVVFLAEVPADLQRYYPDDYYFIARSGDEMAAWGEAERYKLDIVLPHCRAGRLIEVGPASGAFACLARRHGFDVTAIEMDERCARYLSTQAGLDVIHSADEARALEGAPAADVIAMWHVIEHLVDPWTMLSVAARKLKPGGVLVLATPNPHAAQFRVFGARWTHVDAPRHLWLIPPEVLERRGADCGLELVSLTTRDPGSLSWNRFGWQYSLANAFGYRAGGRLASLAGGAAAALAAPLEAREGRGAAYTAVLRKP